VVYDSKSKAILRHCKIGNEGMLALLPQLSMTYARRRPMLCVERIASYGMPVGEEVFTTCIWVGRFIQAWDGQYRLVFRREVKLHLCGQSRAKDGNVRQALIDIFGPGKPKAIGTKKAPGPLYGFAGDEWAALGVAVVASTTAECERAPK
jgi:hypothetical protein